MDSLEPIKRKIYEIRGQRVMLDFDLAELYQVETRVLNQAVKRNIARFPDDFMFQLTDLEWSFISSQFVMTSRAKRPKSALPLAFTEHGALMLSSVLKSGVAIETSIKITRAFVAIRHMVVSLPKPEVNSDVAQLRKDFEDLKLDIEDILHDQNDINEATRAQLDAISAALAELQSKEPRQKPRRPIGFVTPSEEADTAADGASKITPPSSYKT